MPLEEIPQFETRLLDVVRRKEPELLQQIDRTGDLPSETRETLMALIRAAVPTQVRS